jgi:hypothetical protein
MATATITGTISANVANSGPSAAVQLGSPVITPSSSTGATLEFEEQMTNTFKVPTGGYFTIPFGSISDADILYIGTDQAANVRINGGTEVFTLAVGGFILFYLGSITAIEIEPTALEATVQVSILGLN